MAASLAATDLTRVKAFMGGDNALGETTPELDAALNVWIAVVSELVERYLQCTLLKAERTETIHVVRPNQRFVALPATPIDTAAAITVKEAPDRDFAAATAVEADSLHVDGPAGLIHLDTWLNRGAVYDAHGTVQVTYTGGKAGSLSELEAGFPAIVQAANTEVKYRYDSRSRVGKDSESLGGAAVTLTGERSKSLSAEARSLLDSHRRRLFRG